MVCRVRSEPAGSITWYKDGIPVTNSTAHQIEERVTIYETADGSDVTSHLGRLL